MAATRDAVSRANAFRAKSIIIIIIILTRRSSKGVNVKSVLSTLLHAKLSGRKRKEKNASEKCGKDALKEKTDLSTMSPSLVI